jgi:mycofactocin precursor
MPEMRAPSSPAAATPEPDPPVVVAAAPEPADELVELVEADLLVEDVSIDGMCGVY